MAGSFSAGAKAELCKGFSQKQCCALAECFGILLFCNSFGSDGIRFSNGYWDFNNDLWYFDGNGVASLIVPFMVLLFIIMALIILCINITAIPAAFALIFKSAFSFKAVAGGVKDTMTIEKVDVEPEIYTLPQTDDGNEGAANWFTAMGDVELDDGPMEFPEGKMSVKTTIGDIYKNPAAWEFFSKMSGGKMGPDMPMWAMMQNFNLEMLMGMMGNAPESALKAINKQLNAFDIIV